MFTTPRGEPKSFVASDHVHSPAYRAFTHNDLFDIVARHGLHFDQSRQKGVVLHMVNGIGEQGSLGLTAVGNTREEAEALVSEDGRRARRGSETGSRTVAELTGLRF